jgi:hydrogenase/urease accessory protein HupE
MLVVALLLFLPGEASAHLVSTRFGELYSGMLHPLTSLQHLVPWLALGLLGGLQPPSTGRWALLAFPAAVLLGLGLHGLLPELAFVDGFNFLTFILLGVMVTFRLELEVLPFLTVVVLVGLSHGYANASAELSGYAAFLYALGVGLVAYVLIALVAGAAQQLHTTHSWGHVAIRAAGSWIAAAGAMYAGFLLLVA